jgi:hypothetical protein
MRIPVDDVVDPYGADAEKPQADDGRENEADPVRAVVLQGEQANQYSARYR